MINLGHKYNCDKPDGVLNWYDGLFSRLKGKTSISVLEIGINQGGSVCMLRDYFEQKATICGLDIRFDKIKWDMRGINLSYADQSSRNSLDKGCSGIFTDSFDIIIDDGSHVMAHQQITLGHMFKKLKSNGIYIIEDLHTSTEMGHKNFLQGCPIKDTTLAVIERAHKSWESTQISADELIYLNSNTSDILLFSCCFHKKIYTDIWGRSINAAVLKK